MDKWQHKAKYINDKQVLKEVECSHVLEVDQFLDAFFHKELLVRGILA